MSRRRRRGPGPSGGLVEGPELRRRNEILNAPRRNETRSTPVPVTVIGALVLGLIFLTASSCALGAKRDRSREHRVTAPEPGNGDLVVCPECGGELRCADSTPFVWAGETQYFCRPACLREFKQKQYTAARAGNSLHP